MPSLPSEERNDIDDKKEVLTSVVSGSSAADSTKSLGQIRGAELVDVHALNLSSVSRKAKFFWNRRVNNIDLDGVATQPSVYDVPEKRDLYWPRSDYENLHRFDIDLRWTWREELKLVRKIDWKIFLWVAIMFFCLELDRANISQALSDNMLDDLGMITNEYNNGMTIFYCSFLFAELPSQLISKKVGPDRWIPTQITLWSIVAMMQFFLKGKSTFYVTRFLLGILQGGFIPDCILYMSYFYTGSELPVRCAFFWTSMIIADIISAFLGYGILHMRGVHGHAGWRWLFLIEGAFTLIVGLLAYLMMPSSPTSTASWFRGKNGWFTPREESIITSRALRDDPAKGTMHNRQGISPKLLWKSVKDYRLWPIYFIGLCYGIPNGPVKSYLTLSLRSLGFGTFKTNLLTIPANFLMLLQLLAITYISELVESRALVAGYAQIWLFPLLVALQTFGPHTSKWARYAVSALVVGYPYPHAIQVAWNSRNSNSVRGRTVSASLYNMCVQLSSIIYQQIYRTDDAPLYKRGNKVLLAINCFNIFLYVAVHFFYKNLNKKREVKWKSLTKAEQENYVRNTTDEGTARLDFRFAA